MKRTVLSYPAIFNPSREGGFDVLFPDFPGCVTFGGTFEEAKIKAAEVLELWLVELTEDHQDIPVYAHRPIIDEVQVTQLAR